MIGRPDVFGARIRAYVWRRIALNEVLPTNKAIAREIGCDPWTVWRHLALLYASGEVVVYGSGQRRKPEPGCMPPPEPVE